MTKTVRRLLVLVGVLALSVAAGQAADEADGKTENPKYQFWAHFKPGASSTYLEKTILHGPEKASVPGGVEQKTITYRLLNVSKDRATVLTTVLEENFLETVESAPTRITFPAKVSKAHLQALLQEWNAKEGEEETVMVGGKEIKCKVRSGTQKTDEGNVEFKICYSDKVPGGFVKRRRVTRDGDKIVAETTITLQSFAEGKPARPKAIEPAKPKVIESKDGK